MGFFRILPRGRRGSFLRTGERERDDPERPHSHIAARVRYAAVRRGARPGVSSSFVKDSASVAWSRSLAPPPASIPEPFSASASTSEALPTSGNAWRCVGSSESETKSASESTSDAPSIDWTSESDEGRSESWDDESEEKSRSVGGGVASAARVAGSGRVTFGRSICVRR